MPATCLQLLAFRGRLQGTGRIAAGAVYMLSHRRRPVPSVGVCWSRFCARVLRHSAAGALLALSLVLPTHTQAWARPMIRTVTTPLGWLTAPQPRLQAAPSATHSGRAVQFWRRAAFAGISYSGVTPPAVRASAEARAPLSRPVHLAGTRMSSAVHVLAPEHGCWVPLRGVVPGAGGMRARPHAIWHRVFNHEVDAGRFRPCMGVGRRAGGRGGSGCGRFTSILAVGGKGGDGCEGTEDIAGVGESGSNSAAGSGVCPSSCVRVLFACTRVCV